MTKLQIPRQTASNFGRKNKKQTRISRINTVFKRSCELGVENVINGINDIKNISSISTYYSGISAYYSKLNAEITAAPRCFRVFIY